MCACLYLCVYLLKNHEGVKISHLWTNNLLRKTGVVFVRLEGFKIMSEESSGEAKKVLREVLEPDVNDKGSKLHS